MGLNQLFTKLLRAAGKTQTQLAAKLNKSQSTISDRLAKEDVDEVMVKALAELIGRPEAEIWEEIKENIDHSIQGNTAVQNKIKSYEEEITRLKVENEKLRVSIFNYELLKERLNHYEDVIRSKEKDLLGKESIIQEKEKIITQKNGLIEKYESLTNKLKGKVSDLD